MTNDLRLIEDYLPIEAISKEASREKSVRKGHISTLHLWWARRPLVACRAAVYGALVPADRWVKDVEIKNPPADQSMVLAMKNGTKRGLNRKAAKDFVTKLCRYPKTDPTSPADIKIKNETEAAIVEAQKHILYAHADRLTAELAEAKNSGKSPAWVAEFNFNGEKVTYDDIIAGRAPRPRVLDMFAGGGAIPLEALRLGCEAYALDLNPVAHIIQLCTLVYPQKFGKPDPDVRGMTGAKNAKGETTWGGLADEVRYWGNWVLEKVRKEIGDLYPPIPRPAIWEKPPKIAIDRRTGQWNVTEKGKLIRGVTPEIPTAVPASSATIFADDEGEDGDGEIRFPPVELPVGFLQPVAYLWTRTVRCKNPNCAATVPLLRQTWLCKKVGRYVALKMVAPKNETRVRFEVVESETEKGLGFDPEAFSSAGNATCPFCGAIADNDHVRLQASSHSIGQQFMCTVAVLPGKSGKIYLSGTDTAPEFCPDSEDVAPHIERLLKSLREFVPDQTIEVNPRSFDTQHYAISHWKDLYTARQRATLASFARAVVNLRRELCGGDLPASHADGITTILALMVSRTANFSSTLCLWNYTGGRGVVHSFSRQSLPMTWDFPESNPFYSEAAGWSASISAFCSVAKQLPLVNPANVRRGDARKLHGVPLELDAIVTDPPYYDNVSYSNLSDFFYVWLNTMLKDVHPEHFAGVLTPKGSEIISAFYRHEDDRDGARAFYENGMQSAFAQAKNHLKRNGSMVIVYAHKTTLGWSTLVDSLRNAGLEVVEAWPLDTERPGGMKVGKAMLASSIFLVARKRETDVGLGDYERSVQPELATIVAERVETLWEMGIAGADLVIACVGAGLRAFTKYEKVEYANGEEVPAEKFLAEVEGVVLDAMMGKLLGATGGNVSSIDSASRFYVLWRFVYKTAEIDAGEAIVFTYSQHVELDGPHGLSGDANALVEKKKAKYRTRDFTERGQSEKLGLPTAAGQPAPLVDQLHRILWLMENSPRKLGDFIDEAKPDRERLRVLAQALAGAALSGKSDADAGKLVSTTTAEQSALGKLLANWRNLVENRMIAEEKTLFGTKG